MFLPARLGSFALVAAACMGLSAAGALRGAAVLPLALAAVAVAMWHGAYDHVQAETMLARPLGPRWLLVFLAGYAGLVALTLLGWWLFPLVSLVAFLLYSAWHFGTEPEETTPSPRVGAAALALGAVPIVAACRWHGAAVEPIFAQMLGQVDAGAAPGLTGVLSRACRPVLAAAFLAIGSGVLGRSWAARFELAAVALLQAGLFVWCDPLIAFAVYFCCWHTPEHLLATSMPEPDRPSLRANLRRNLRAGLVPWLLSLVFVGVAFAYVRRGAAAYEGELFVILSALTVPHMALNELRRARWPHPTFQKGART